MLLMVRSRFITHALLAALCLCSFQVHALPSLVNFPLLPSRSRINIRGGATDSTAALGHVQPSRPGRDSVQVLTVPQVFSGAVIAVIIFAMDWSVRGASLLILFSSLLAIRAVDSSAAYSVVQWLSPAFSLHDHFSELLLCPPLVMMPLVLSGFDLQTVLKLSSFFVIGSIVLLVCLLGLSEFLLPIITGSLSSELDSDVASSIPPPPLHPPPATGVIHKEIIASAALGAAVASFVLKLDFIFILSLNFVALPMIDRRLSLLSFAVPAVITCIASIFMGVYREKDWKGYLMRFRNFLYRDAPGDMLLLQSTGAWAALLLHMWRHKSVSSQQAFPFVTSIMASATNLLCTIVAENDEGKKKRKLGNLPSTPPVVDDRMPRWPNLTPGGLLRLGDWIGTACCSLGGTLAGAERGMDLLGCMVMGTVTSVGGGTIRDLFIGHENGVPKRAFWMSEPEYLAIVYVMSLLSFFGWNSFASRFRLSLDDAWMFWWDTLGISCFTCIGTMNGIRASLHPVVVGMCGMFSSTFGGFTRDVISRHPVRILHAHQEMYAVPPLIGSFAYQAVRSLGLPLWTRILSGFLTTMAIRFCTWKFDLRLPVLASVYSHKETKIKLVQPVTGYSFLFPQERRGGAEHTSSTLKPEAADKSKRAAKGKGGKEAAGEERGGKAK
mmetsp:Transcript_7760/g.26180  ORF Transcript_7760/g.26180 Transcript_7760/m.26180 type:complete len:666 (-) Transcript_7760:21-2018(-)